MTDEVTRGTKRKREGDDDSEENISEEDFELDEDAINKIVEEAPEVEAIDIVTMKRMLVTFERAYTKNQQLRVKYPKQPEKFMDSEVDLDEEIKKLHVIATAPSLYPDFTHLKAHESILSLLVHENTDVTVDAIDLIKELTDSDVYEEKPESVKQLVDAMLEHQILELLVSNLNRLQESQPDEKQGVFNILAIMENLLEVKIELREVLGEKTEILTWILKRIQVREFDDVKQYSSEILSILLQNSQKNSTKVIKAGGIDVLLMAVARYKKINPPTKEEEEFVENIFNALCCVCPLEEAKKSFTQAEGLKLIQIMIKNKRYARKCGLKLLDYVMSGDSQNCRRWVQLPGLGTLFTAFMKKGSKKHKKGFAEFEDDEHIMSIIAALLRHLDQMEQGKLWSRVVDKFRENNSEKVERLLELYEKYNSKLRQAQEKINQEKKQILEDEDEIDPSWEDIWWGQKMDAGLFCLQLVCYVMAVISVAQPEIKAKVQQLLTFQDSSFDHVKDILVEYSQNIGSDAMPATQSTNNSNSSSASTSTTTTTTAENNPFKEKVLQLANEIAVKTYQ